MLASRASTDWDVSAGTLDIGRWGVQAALCRPLRRGRPWGQGGGLARRPAHLRPRDVAEVRLAREENPVLRIQNGNTAIAAQIFKEAAPTPWRRWRIKAKVGELNREVLEPVGLHMEQSFDASPLHQPGGGHGDRQPGAGVLLSCAILWSSCASSRRP